MSRTALGCTLGGSGSAWGGCGLATAAPTAPRAGSSLLQTGKGQLLALPSCVWNFTKVKSSLKDGGGFAAGKGRE